MNPRDFSQSEASSAPAAPDGHHYRISLTLSVTDADTLWTAAAALGLARPGMTIDDIIDVVGPREAPSISDCIAMLAGPSAVPGCAVEDFQVEALDGPAEAQGRFYENRPLKAA